MAEVIDFIAASKQTRHLNWLMVPLTGGPPIAPPLDDLDGNRTSTFFQASKASRKRYGAVEVKLIRGEGSSESPAEGILKVAAEFRVN